MASAAQPSLQERIFAWLFAHPDLFFGVLRWVKPVLATKGLSIVTRFDHVQEVLSRDWVFQVPYRQKMERVTAGQNFFLGMQNTPEYTRDVSNMRLAVRRTDVDERIAPFVTRTAEDILAASGGHIDVVQTLTRVVPTRLLGDYFGTPGWDENEFTDAATAMFQYLFYPDDPAVERLALEAAAKTRAYLDALIAERKRDRGHRDDVIERCLAMQDAGLPGMDDLSIRNNLIGLIIGAIPTTSKSAVLTLDYLLSHAELLPKAQAAARADDDALMAKYVLECLRFNSFAAGIARVCAEDYVVARGTLWATRIPKGGPVLAATQSAMMDWRALKSPKEFLLDRPDHVYMHFGYALHTCFGYYINLVQIPRIVKAVLKREGLRRAAGAEGQMQSAGPFPVHMRLEFNS